MTLIFLHRRKRRTLCRGFTKIVTEGTDRLALAFFRLLKYEVRRGVESAVQFSESKGMMLRACEMFGYSEGTAEILRKRLCELQGERNGN